MRLTLEPGQDIVAMVRAATAESLVVVAAPSSDALWLALTRGAIGPLAIAHAPNTRVNAIFAAEGAAQADIAAAVAFLERAHATTGQIIDLRAAHPA